MRRSAMSTSVVAVISGAMIALVSLAPAPARAADPAADLADARARWQARSAQDYSYRIQMRCNACVGDLGEAKTVRVLDGKPRTLSAHFRPYDTVEDLFSVVEGAL